MLFDFDTFERCAKLAHRESRTGYSFTEAIDVFRCYFETYEFLFDTAHPAISRQQIKSIIEKMSYCGHEHDHLEISPDMYPALIRRHFETRYRNCDFNINHFFSGRIRLMRFWDCEKSGDI